MQLNDLPQEGDLLLCFALGDRAAKYFPKQADFLSEAQSGLNQAGDWLNQNALQPAVGAFNKHVTDPVTNHAKANLGIPTGNFREFMDRNPWAIAPLIGGGLGAGVGLLGSGGKKKKDILGSVLQSAMLGAGAGGLAWGAREMLNGVGQPANPPTPTPSNPKPLEGVGGTPFNNPAAPDTRNSPKTFLGAQIPFTGGGATDNFTDALTQSDKTREWKTQVQVPATDAAGGLMSTAAKLNQPGDWNRLSNLRESARQPGIDPATGQVNTEVENSVKSLIGLNKDIGGRYAAPTSDPLSRVGNSGALGSVVGLPSLVGVGTSAGPVDGVANSGSETAANLGANSSAEQVLGGGSAQTPTPHWSNTAGFKDLAVGAGGSAVGRGLLSRQLGMPAPAAVPSNRGMLERGAKATAKGLNSLVNPLADLGGPQHGLLGKAVSPLKPKNLVAGGLLAAARHAQPGPSSAPLTSILGELDVTNPDVRQRLLDRFKR